MWCRLGILLLAILWVSERNNRIPFVLVHELKCDLLLGFKLSSPLFENKRNEIIVFLSQQICFSVFRLFDKIITETVLSSLRVMGKEKHWGFSFAIRENFLRLHKFLKEPKEEKICVYFNELRGESTEITIVSISVKFLWPCLRWHVTVVRYSIQHQNNCN